MEGSKFNITKRKDQYYFGIKYKKNQLCFFFFLSMSFNSGINWNKSSQKQFLST